MAREVAGPARAADARYEMLGEQRADGGAVRADRQGRADAHAACSSPARAGTGKELIARAIHRYSALADKPVRQGQLRGDPAAS